MIFTFGYGNRSSYKELLEHIKAYDIRYLVDVRKTPYGWSKIWHCGELEDFCNRNEVRYISKKELGNTAPSSKWIPANQKIANESLKSLVPYCKQNIILLCAEANVNKCHRKEVAHQLSLITNIEIEHLL